MIRIVGWNIRAGGGKRITEILQQLLRWQPDLIALSEFRATPPSVQLASELHHAGFTHQRTGHGFGPTNKAANRVFVASRYPLRKFDSPGAPQEPGRWLTLNVLAPVPFRLGAMHIPNQVTGRKGAFHAGVLAVAKHWAKHRMVMIGDTNSGQIGIDETSPVFNQQTHNWFDTLADLGWADAYRRRHGQRREYTWYSPNKGNGFRLDQAFLSPLVVPGLVAIEQRWGEVDGSVRREHLSDHAALILDVDLG